MMPAEDDYYVGAYNTPLVINTTNNILLNDGPSPANSSFNITSVTRQPPVTDGRIAWIDLNIGTFEFIPARGFTGNTSFDYGACWSGTKLLVLDRSEV